MQHHHKDFGVIPLAKANDERQNSYHNGPHETTNTTQMQVENLALSEALEPSKSSSSSSSSSSSAALSSAALFRGCKDQLLRTFLEGNTTKYSEQEIKQVHKCIKDYHNAHIEWKNKLHQGSDQLFGEDKLLRCNAADTNVAVCPALFYSNTITAKYVLLLMYRPSSTTKLLDNKTSRDIIMPNLGFHDIDAAEKEIGIEELFPLSVTENHIMNLDFVKSLRQSPNNWMYENFRTRVSCIKKMREILLQKKLDIVMSGGADVTAALWCADDDKNTSLTDIDRLYKLSTSNDEHQTYVYHPLYHPSAGLMSHGDTTISSIIRVDFKKYHSIEKGISNLALDCIKKEDLFNRIKGYFDEEVQKAQLAHDQFMENFSIMFPVVKDAVKAAKNKRRSMFWHLEEDYMQYIVLVMNIMLGKPLVLEEEVEGKDIVNDVHALDHGKQHVLFNIITARIVTSSTCSRLVSITEIIDGDSEFKGGRDFLSDVLECPNLSSILFGKSDVKEPWQVVNELKHMKHLKEHDEELFYQLIKCDSGISRMANAKFIRDLIDLKEHDQVFYNKICKRNGSGFILFDTSDKMEQIFKLDVPCKNFLERGDLLYNKYLWEASKNCDSLNAFLGMITIALSCFNRIPDNDPFWKRVSSSHNVCNLWELDSKIFKNNDDKNVQIKAIFNHIKDNTLGFYNDCRSLGKKKLVFNVEDITFSVSEVNIYDGSFESAEGDAQQKFINGNAANQDPPRTYAQNRKSPSSDAGIHITEYGFRVFVKQGGNRIEIGRCNSLEEGKEAQKKFYNGEFLEKRVRKERVKKNPWSTTNPNTNIYQQGSKFQVRIVINKKCVNFGSFNKHDEALEKRNEVYAQLIAGTYKPKVKESKTDAEKDISGRKRPNDNGVFTPLKKSTHLPKE